MISGPSGAGKSTVVFKALEGRDDVCFSVSATTRKPRPGEIDGKEYFFVDLDKFRDMVQNMPSMWQIPTELRRHMLKRSSMRA